MSAIFYIVIVFATICQCQQTISFLIKDDLQNRGYTNSGERLPPKLPEYLRNYGENGKNYYLDENNKPYILCKYYNTDECTSDQTEVECTQIKKCYAETRAHGVRCMSAFVFNGSISALHDELLISAKNNTAAPAALPTAVRKDCWSQSASELADCDNDNECVLQHRPVSINESAALFCCCQTHECNANVSYRMISTTTIAPAQHAINISKWANNSNSALWLPLIVALFLCICAAFAFLIFAVRQKYLIDKKLCLTDSADNKSAAQNRADIRFAAGNDDIAALINGKNVNMCDIKLVELISNGRFGHVYKALASETMVAIKMFPLSDVDSWICEQDLYSIEAFRTHSNISTFVAAFPRDNSFWLLTTFCNNGSLYDYLKTHTISLHELSNLAYSMLNGLAFLHEESTSAITVKPIIVHRDIKSKNILIKDDLTACITDFGLAVKCETRRIAPNGIHGQVGTRRYMSPELLEGAIEFSSFAFRQADVYATSLVIWELLTRTKLPKENDEQIENYALPFDAEIGHIPSLSEIRNLVVVQKFRPRLRDALQKNEFTNALIKTMSEMWEKEPDARITTGCARERVQRIQTAISHYYTFIKKEKLEVSTTR